jgi:hypothetical protein
MSAGTTTTQSLEHHAMTSTMPDFRSTTEIRFDIRSKLEPSCVGEKQISDEKLNETAVNQKCAFQ